MESSRDLGLYLAAVRTSPLADWVSSFDPDTDCHTMERSLRAQWQRYVGAVSSWHPLDWQDFVAWIAWLPGLCLLSQLARPDPAPAWMLADPLYGPLAPGAPADRASALSHSALSALHAALTTPGSARAAWSAHWLALRPRADPRTQHSLELLLQAMQRHEQELMRTADSAERLRGELENRMQRLLRTAAGTAIVSVCHLALVALDLERLRGSLARRSLFAGQAEQR
jgi:hypothetical protein